MDKAAPIGIVRTTPSAVLDVPGTDADGPSLWSAPLHAWRYESADGGHEYLACVDAPLGRRGLMTFLATIAPYKGRGLEDFSGVLDDWYLHDRALAGGASETLFRQHLESLRDDWQEFSRHRQLFIDILEDRTEATRLLPVLRWRLCPDGTRAWVFDPPEAQEDVLIRQAIPAETSGHGGAALSPLAGFLAVLYFLPELTTGWPEWKPLSAEGKSNYMGPAQVPVLALLNKHRLLPNPLTDRLEGLVEGGSGH